MMHVFVGGEVTDGERVSASVVGFVGVLLSSLG